MVTGETFSIGGYDVVAHAMTMVDGIDVVVLNNNSSHYLVATREADYADRATLAGSFPYVDAMFDKAKPEGDMALEAYEKALDLMVRLVKEN